MSHDNQYRLFAIGSVVAWAYALIRPDVWSILTAAFLTVALVGCWFRARQEKGSA